MIAENKEDLQSTDYSIVQRKKKGGGGGQKGPRQRKQVVVISEKKTETVITDCDIFSSLEPSKQKRD